MIYETKLPTSYRKEFVDKVIRISKDLGVRPEWLMQLMKAESGLDWKAVNYQNGRLVAAGLIQFTAPTAAGLGTNHSYLLSMGALNQLDYVKKYFLPYKGRMNNYFDVYLVTFFPAAIGKPDNYTFQTSSLSASLIAQQNPAININKDQKITMAEFKQYVEKTVPVQYYAIMFPDKKKVT